MTEIPRSASFLHTFSECLLADFSGSSAQNGSCESEKTPKTTMYMFVGRPHFSSPSYGECNATKLDKTGFSGKRNNSTNQVCKGDPLGSDYRGTVSVTRSGKTCQRWDVDSPHSRRYLPEEYCELVDNYCRNPDGDENTIWCYTTDPGTRWEYCIHPTCPVVCMGNSTGSDYRGNVSVTLSGRTCQRWDVAVPHEPYYKPEEYPELMENYCRNPDEYEPGIWCYTTDPDIRWEHCFNPACH
ncbi:plasminogen-like [Branchiostoma floridae]|uniref:Plasminogen-like n=1 Tax=Branchiostoma floridae TaxID=7739 RepID=A0A9J7LIF8_BRAFL|nr:plasminogen-like [Branchiostoma floridae]